LVRLERVLDNESARREGMPQCRMMPLLKVVLTAPVVISHVVPEEGKELVAQQFDLEFLTPRIDFKFEVTRHVAEGLELLDLREEKQPCLVSNRHFDVLVDDLGATGFELGPAIDLHLCHLAFQLYLPVSAQLHL
jgi:hypothetical protein